MTYRRIDGMLQGSWPRREKIGTVEAFDEGEIGVRFDAGKPLLWFAPGELRYTNEPRGGTT